MSNIYFSSDFHGYHKNICRGVTQWVEDPKLSSIHGIQSTRDFPTVEAMNEAILKGINDTVGQDDTLYFLGDFVFNGGDKVTKFRDRIHCKNIHFILGNHDKHIPAHSELFRSVEHYKRIAIGSQEIIMSHYAFRVWDRSHHGSIMLYGHSHDSLDRGGEIWGKSMDVGIDSAFRLFGEYRPFSLEEILGIMRKRDTLIIDHHNKNTN